MQIFKQCKLYILFSCLLVGALILSAIPLTVSAPTPSIIPTSTALLPEEVDQYQGVSLTPISDYIAYLKAHPDVAIKGTQYIDQSYLQTGNNGTGE